MKTLADFCPFDPFFPLDAFWPFAAVVAAAAAEDAVLDRSALATFSPCSANELSALALIAAGSARMFSAIWELIPLRVWAVAIVSAEF